MSDNEEELVNYSQLTTHAQEALFQCLENKGRLQKSVCQGIVESGGVRITVSKGTHLHTVGFSHQGHIRLHPEEAAFLVSRNALVVRDGDRVLDFEDLVELIVDDVWLTLDKYQVYAYLKRLGYIVVRAKVSDQSVFTENTNQMSRSLQKKPLVWNYACSDYNDIYSRLRIIPSFFQYSSSKRWMMDWEVFKPRANWKKKDPGVPDYKISVANVRDPVPTLETRYQMIAQSDHTKLLIALVGDTEGVLFYQTMGNTVHGLV
ncbi:unnamed protein product [Rhizopus stolonifer]